MKSVEKYVKDVSVDWEDWKKIEDEQKNFLLGHIIKKYAEQVIDECAVYADHFAKTKKRRESIEILLKSTVKDIL